MGIQTRQLLVLACQADAESKRKLLTMLEYRCFYKQALQGAVS